MTDWQCQRKISEQRQHSLATAAFRAPAYLSSLSKIMAVFNNIWLMDEQYFNSLEDSRIKQSVDWGTLWGAQWIADYCWQTPGDTAQHSTSLQALPWLQRCSHPHLNPNDILTKLTMNLSAVGGNGIWGVRDTSMPVRSYFSVAGSKKPWWGWAAAPTQNFGALQSSKAWQVSG